MGAVMVPPPTPTPTPTPPPLGQVDKLLAAMGLPRASRPLPAPPAARPATSRSYAAASVSPSSSQR